MPNQNEWTNLIIDPPCDAPIPAPPAFDTSVPPAAEPRPSLDLLVRFGRYMYDASFAHTPDEDEAFKRIVEASFPILMLRTDRIGDAPDAQDHGDVATNFLLARWFGSGCPRVRLRAARAASFAATAIPAEYVTEIRPPWPAFLIDIEGEPLLVDPDCPSVVYDQIEVLYAKARDGRATWTFFGRSRHLQYVQRLWSTAEEWGSDLTSERVFDSPAEEARQRLYQVMSRIILGTCIALTVPDAVEDARHRGRSKRFRNDRRGPPQITNFVMTNDVKLDVRSAVTDYIGRGGSCPTVQSLVRGHWKRQAHGPGYSLRKWIHIEPYWRGPEDGPVAVRSHVLAAIPPDRAA